MCIHVVNILEQVDIIATGEVVRGVLLMPFCAKVLSGLTQPVSVRKLIIKGLSETERHQICLMLTSYVIITREHLMKRTNLNY